MQICIFGPLFVSTEYHGLTSQTLTVVLQEVVVDALSLKRWFCANAASGRSKRRGFSYSASSANTAKSHPYLQPGMTSLMTTNCQESGSRTVCVVSEADMEPDLSVVQGEQRLQHLTKMNHRGQRGRARPMSSARYD